MATEQPYENLHQNHLPAVVKEEPLEKEPEIVSFCYETVTKEEVIINDEIEHDDDQPESVIATECSECDRTFDKVAKLNRCVKRHNFVKLGLYTCKFCGKRCGSKQGQLRHEGIHNKEVNQSQPIEDIPGSEQSNSKDSLQQGSTDCIEKFIKEKNTEKDKTEESYQSNDRNSIESSAKNVLEENNLFKCSECNRAFDNVDGYKRCKKRHNAIKHELFKCKTCGKCFHSKYDLTRHENGHKKEILQLQPVEVTQEGGEKSFKCSECNQTFKDQSTATKCEKKHLSIRMRLYECKYCKLRVGTQVALKKHELRHKKRAERKEDKLKSFACELCGKCFVKKESIEQHVCAQEEEEARFTCHKCKVKFPNRGDLLSHIRRHDWDETKRKYFEKLVTDDKGNHLCTICNRRFVNQRTAANHVFRHMNMIEGLLECKTCGMKCGDSYEYKIHIQIHTKPEESVVTDKNRTKESDAAQKSTELDCKICLKRLRNKQSLERHEIIHRKYKKRKQTAKGTVEPEKGSKEDENITSFCYETVVKEELMIEDDAFGESTHDEQEEDSFQLLDQPVEDQDNNKQVEESSELSRDEGTTELNYECDFCQKTFVKKYSLIRHMKAHKKGHNKVESQRCNEKLDERNSLLKPNKTHNKKTKKSKHLDYLVKDKDGHRCLLCESTFRIRSTATTHVQRHMNVIEGKFQCNVCGLRLGGTYDYQLHIKVHKNGSDQMALPREREDVHTDYDSSSNVACEKSDLPMHCKTCNVFFNNKTNLNIHLWKSKLRIIRLKPAVTENMQFLRNTKKKISQVQLV